MTLATHASVGAVTAALFPSHPIIAFFAGFFSHFILDSIPHWDYKIRSPYANSRMAMCMNEATPGATKTIKLDKTFLLDLRRIGLDVLIGVVILNIIYWNQLFNIDWHILILGAVGGMTPDFLQFVYMRFPHQPLIMLQKLHTFFHAKHTLNNRPIIGVATQAITVLVAGLLINFLI
jgi:hypothetical protein